MRTILISLSLFLALCTSTGCLALAAGAGIVVSKEVLPNDVYVAQVTTDVDQCWPASQEVLRSMGAEDLVVSEHPRRVRAKFEGYDLIVTVEAYDLNRTTIRVEAYKFMVSDGDMASRVLTRILDQLSAAKS